MRGQPRRWTQSHDSIWGPRNHLLAVTLSLPLRGKIACGAVHYSAQIYIMSVSSVERVTRTCTCVPMICKPTHTVSLVLSQMISLLLCSALSLSVLSLLFLSLSLFLTDTLTYIAFFVGVVRIMSLSEGYWIVDVSVLKTLFLWMCRKVYIYGNTLSLACYEVYPTSNMCDINTSFFEGLKSCENPANCAGSPNKCFPRHPKLIAIDMTAIAICECLVLGPGPCRLAPFITLPYAPIANSPTAHCATIPRLPCLFVQTFPSVAPQKCDLFGTCGNLANLRYPCLRWNWYILMKCTGISSPRVWLFLLVFMKE